MDQRTALQITGKPSFLLLLTAFCLSGIFAQTEGSLEDYHSERAQKRYIHPKSRYLALSAGFGFTATNTQDPNRFLAEGVTMENNTYLPNIMYEHGVTSGFFAEVGYSYIGMGISYKRVVGEGSNSSYSEYFKNHDIQFGMGYRVINRRNYHFLNIHAGVFVGFANENLEGLPLSSTYRNTDPATDAPYFITQSVTDFRPVSFGPYLGISKELRLTKEIHFFVKYVQRFGLSNTMSGTFELQSDEIAFDNGMATFQVRGSGAFVTGGLKIMLNKNASKYNYIR